MAAKRTFFIAYAAGAIVVLLTVASTIFLLRTPRPKLLNYRNAPSFDLIDQAGREFKSAGMKGKVWLVSFIYTRCKGPCPILTKQLEDLQGEAFKNPSARFVSISLDPEYDTVEVLREYGLKHNAVEGKWLFLTGSKQTVRNLAESGFAVSALDQPDPANPIIHSTKFILVDKKGMIRAFFDGGQLEKNQEILRAIRLLEKEL